MAKEGVMLAKILFVLVIISGLATLGMLFAGLISMSRNVDGNIEGGRRSNRLMWWRVRLQFLTIILILLWYFANQSQG
jgi:hypoxia induced protein